ncbi:MAG: threonine--tRNA ligase [Amoebophilaceae bacterium]|jgi:threonyl-tRNA synthetase|nr:threonine--tRNA ligase [Amoebophilaceae bacterium]
MHYETISITLPDGMVKSFPSGTTGLDIAKHVSEGLSRRVLAMLVNGEVHDATRSIYEDAIVQLLTWNDEAGKRVFWHSTAHLLAEALEALYPGIRLGIGPAIDRGFYYDVDFGQQVFDATHLEKLEAKMLDLARQQNPYLRIEVSKREAIEYFLAKGGTYKLDILERLVDEQVTFYRQGAFTDLCKGPHLPHTGFIKAVKLLNVAGAYWRGNEENKQLTRIYGISFPQHKELKAHLLLLEEAKKRNHQRLGKELGLFTFSEKVGIGLPLWLPKGAVLRERLEQFLREAQLRAGYQSVVTPHVGLKSLYITSGHYEKYGQNSFQPIQTPHAGEEFVLKPMNCPHHCEIYKSEPKSYRDLPVRLAEFGTVYRYEQHGELHGLARTRCFTQDDAHIFCRLDQVKEEFEKVIDLVLYVFEKLEFRDYTAQLSLRALGQSSKYIGKDQDWERAEEELQEVVIQKGLKATRAPGEAAFYGPKLDFMVKDALGRGWQLGTVQLDYQLPERFDLTYVGKDSKKHRPVLIHRAPFGSLERFIALLLEHTGGKLPLWLAPDQVAVLPISEKYSAYADQVYQMLVHQNIRGFVDHRDEKIGKKIRNAEFCKVPYMLIVGEKEMLERTVAVRRQGVGDQGSKHLDEFVAMIVKELA